MQQLPGWFGKPKTAMHIALQPKHACMLAPCTCSSYTLCHSILVCLKRHVASSCWLLQDSQPRAPHPASTTSHCPAPPHRTKPRQNTPHPPRHVKVGCARRRAAEHRIPAVTGAGVGSCTEAAAGRGRAAAQQQGVSLCGWGVKSGPAGRRLRFEGTRAWRSPSKLPLTCNDQ